MLKLLLTFGMFGDYCVLRDLTLKYRIFYPLYKLYEVFHCANLPLATNIKGYITFPHSPKGCFISLFATIDTGCIIMQQVTIGSNNVAGGGNYGPQIGKNVFIGAGAKIIGNVKIGNNVKIGAGCIVVHDIPDNATVVMPKPRIIIK